MHACPRELVRSADNWHWGLSREEASLFSVVLVVRRALTQTDLTAPCTNNCPGGVCGGESFQEIRQRRGYDIATRRVYVEKESGVGRIDGKNIGMFYTHEVNENLHDISNLAQLPPGKQYMPNLVPLDITTGRPFPDDDDEE
jgi:hypothetical protein